MGDSQTRQEAGEAAWQSSRALHSAFGEETDPSENEEELSWSVRLRGD